MQRLTIPLVVVGALGYRYLKSFPSGGAALLIVTGGIAVGIVFGLLALTVIRMGKDPATGRLVTIAGPSYVVLWTIALVARLGFAFGSTHWFKSDMSSFSTQHHVPSDTYATAFVLWVSLMILIRTVGVAVWGYRIGANVDFSRITADTRIVVAGRIARVSVHLLERQFEPSLRRQTPGRRVVTSWTSHVLPSGSLNEQNDP